MPAVQPSSFEPVTFRSQNIMIGLSNLIQSNTMKIKHKLNKYLTIKGINKVNVNFSTIPPYIKHTNN